MAMKPLTDQQLRETLDFLKLHDGNMSAAAAAMGVPRTTLASRLETARARGIAPSPERDFVIPEFPDDDIPVEEIISLQIRRFEKRKQSHDAHTWFDVQIKDDKPVGILWMGDPHVDDNGCNWAVLRRHCELARDTDGLYGANIGDTTNNWAGRLMALYANQDASVKTARRLAEFLMLDSGVPWIVWIVGNHDKWGDGSAVLAQMAQRYGTQALVCHDWEVRFNLVFPNGAKFPVHAAHDFPGHSQWNPLHGPMKQGRFGRDACLLIAGHKHNWGVFRFENADKGIHQSFVRVRGYKFMDDYARQRGYPEQETGCAVITIFDPSKPESGVLVFDDVEAGADYLTWLRRV